MNRTAVLAVTAAAMMYGAHVPAALANVNLNVNIGQPAPVIVTSPPPPPPPPHRFVIESRPRFIFTPSLGFHVSVESPYDIVYYGDRYYIQDGGHWYHSSRYNGPWAVIDRDRLPGKLRRYQHAEIRRYRDEEYRRERHNEGRGRGPRDEGRDREWRDEGHDRGRGR